MRATPVVVSPRAKSEVVMSALQGTVLEVIGKDGDWYWIILPRDIHGTRRPGWVAARDVEIVAGGTLSTPSPVAPTAEVEYLRQQVEALRRQLAAIEAGRQQPQPPTVPAEPPALIVPSEPRASAQRERQSGSEERVWIDVNFGLAWASEDSYSAEVRPVIFEELARFGATYSFPRGAEFDFGGGYMITPRFGLGVSFTGTAHEDTADLNISIPHPTFADALADDSAPTDGKLRRVEGAVNLQAMFVAMQNERVRVRFFGGPTYFNVKQDTISNITYEQAFLFFQPVNAVAIDTFETTESEASGWGFHIGGDVSYFFNRVAGVGAFARISRGNVDLDDIGDTVSEVKAGGFQLGAGLRLRF
ncbi:MAG: outer membrane beta-barrel protein [Vicinamibacterales bacterium]